MGHTRSRVRRAPSRRRFAAVVAATALAAGVATAPTGPIGARGTAGRGLAEQSEPAPGDPAPPDAPPAEPALDPGEEDVERRTADSKTFATDTPGVMRTELYGAPVHYEDDGGTWQEIDPVLVEGGDGSFSSEGTPTDVEISVEQSETDVEVDLGDGATAGFDLGSAATGPAGDQGVVVEDVDPGVDVLLEAVPGGLKETIVLASPDTARTFEVPLELEGVEPVLAPGGSIDLVDEAGETRGRIPAGWMVDSSSHPITHQPAESTAVRYELREEEGGTTLVIELDDAWLDDPARTYPVMVDPSVLQANSGLDDTYVMAFSSGDRSGLTHLTVGHNGFLGTRSFLHFDDLSALDDKIIHTAIFKAFQTNAGSCTATPMDIFRVTTAWTGSATTSWGGPPVAATASSAITASKGRTGCGVPADWISGNVTDLVAGWADGTWPNHGLSLRARVETDPAQFKQLGSGESITPPHIQVIWSDVEADAPNPPSDVTPDSTTGTTRPLLTATYESGVMISGAVAFILSDDTGLQITTGLGSPSHSGGTSRWRVPAGLLQPGHSYSVEAFAVDALERASVNSAPVTFTVNPAAMTDITEGMFVFDDMAVPATIAAGSTPDAVELVVDSIAVDSDDTAPYELTWDTSAIPDGDVEVGVRAVTGVTATTLTTETVRVFNESTGTERVLAEYRSGLLTADQYALLTARVAVGDDTLPGRYVTEEGSGDTGEVLGPILEVGDGLSPTTKAAIADLLEPVVTDPPPEELTSFDEEDMCPERKHAAVNRVLPRSMCRYVHEPTDPDMPPITFFYNLGDGDDELDPANVGAEAGLGADTDPANGVPDGIDIAVENMEIAVETYRDLGFELPDYVEEDGFTVAFYDTRGYANPHRRDSNRYPHAITLTAHDTRAELSATARHETFHVFQYNYLSTFDVLGDLCPDGWCRDGGMWWIEVTAEWADGEVGKAHTVAGEHLYYRAFEQFASAPGWDLMSPGLEDLVGALGIGKYGDRHYGTFIFAESLQERYGTDFIVDVFEYIKDNPLNPASEHDVISALETALDDESTDLHTELWRFWISAYLLTEGAAHDLDFADPHVDDWRDELDAAASGDYPEVDGGGISPLARLKREGTFAVSWGSYEETTGFVRRGGAEIYDLDTVNDYIDLERPGYISIQVDPERWDKLSFGLIRYSDDGYPEICPSGPAVVPDDDEGYASIEWEVTEECPTASLIVTHLDPNTSYELGGDVYDINVRGHVET